jgi:hypothetical protein
MDRLVSPLVQKTSKSCSNHHRTMHQKLQPMGKTSRPLTSSPYFISTLSHAANIDTEINIRIAKASATFGRLLEKVWERRGLSITTKRKVYSAAILMTMPYANETWTAYSRYVKQLNHFHLSCLRRFLHVRWQDKIIDMRMLKCAKLPGIIPS